MFATAFRMISDAGGFVGCSSNEQLLNCLKFQFRWKNRGLRKWIANWRASSVWCHRHNHQMSNAKSCIYSRCTTVSTHDCRRQLQSKLKITQKSNRRLPKRIKIGLKPSRHLKRNAMSCDENRKSNCVLCSQIGQLCGMSGVCENIYRNSTHRTASHYSVAVITIHIDERGTIRHTIPIPQTIRDARPYIVRNI